MLEILVFDRIKALLPPRSSVLCALSGGADSVAMTLALCALREKMDINGVSCAHFNHGLRGADADADQDFCAKLCKRLELPLFIGTAAQTPGGYGGVLPRIARQGTCPGSEAEYRRLRYDFLIKTALEQNISYVVTAHTSDDNAETLLLNLTRGTGLDGLTGIPAIRQTRDGVYIIRPMLDVMRSGVLEYLQNSDQDFCDDASNRTDIYRRNRIRHHIIPELQKENPRLLESLSHTSELLKRDREYLDEQATLALKAITISHPAARGCGLIYEGAVSAKNLSSLPSALSFRIIKQMCESANGAPFDLSYKHIDAVLSLCNAGPSAVLNLPCGLTARRIYDNLRIEKAMHEFAFTPVRIDFEQTISLDRIDLKASWTKKPKKINNLVYSFLLSSDTIEGGLTIRSRLSGDFIRLAGRNHSKSLRKLFIDAKVPKHERSGIPILADDTGVAAVGGFGVDERCSPKSDDAGTFLQIYREEQL